MHHESLDKEKPWTSSPGLRWRHHEGHKKPPPSIVAPKYLFNPFPINGMVTTCFYRKADRIQPSQQRMAEQPKPKPASTAPLSPPTSKQALASYLRFLQSYHLDRQYPGPSADIAPEDRIEELTWSVGIGHLPWLREHPEMSAIFDCTDPASPLHYPVAQTALLLLDFQGLAIGLCGSGGKNATAKAKQMRDWALKKKMMVLHSIVDVKGVPPASCKGADRISQILSNVQDDRDAAEEPAELAFAQQDNEYVTLKPPSVISALKSLGAMDLLVEHGIKSLIICGLSTSGCVLRTAVPATDESFIVSIISDACADPKNMLHEMLMEKVLPSRAHVATAEEFIGEWEKSTLG